MSNDARTRLSRQVIFGSRSIEKMASLSVFSTLRLVRQRLVFPRKYNFSARGNEMLKIVNEPAS